MVRSTWCAFRWGFNKVESIRKSPKCHHLFLGSDSNFRVKQRNFAFLLFFLCTEVWPGIRKANSRHDMAHVTWAQLGDSVTDSDVVLIIWKPDLAWLISFGLAATPLIKFESDVKTQFKKGYITDPFTMMVNCEWNNGGEKNFRNDIWNMLQLIVYSISLGQGQ